jgi:hypothetical protein
MAHVRTSAGGLKDRIDHSALGPPARAMWRAGWTLRRAAERATTRTGARFLYGRHARELPRMEYPPGHYHSPIPSAAEVDTFTRHDAPPPLELPGIDLRREEQLTRLEEMRPYYDELPFTADDGRTRTRYRVANDFFPAADALALYGMLRHLRPRRIVEVGSGWSTCVMLDTAERLLHPAPELLLFEPFPERLLELVRPGDEERFTLERTTLQDAPLGAFRSLEADDILFVDSTHVAKVGSDVNRLLFEILPALAPGVYVHVHDVPYPFEYSAQWIGGGRFWNEAYVVRAFLEYNSMFEIALFVDYLRRTARTELAQCHELFLTGVSEGPDRGGAGSLWLRRRDEASS